MNYMLEYKDDIKHKIIDHNEEPALTKKLNLEVLNRLEESHKELLQAYYLDGFNQKQLALFYDCTQANICISLKRARNAYKELEYLSELEESITLSRFRREVRIVTAACVFLPFREKYSVNELNALFDKRLIRYNKISCVVMHFTETLSQSKTAYELKTRQATVRGIVVRTIKLLLDEGFTESAEYLEACFKAKHTNFHLQRKKNPDRDIKSYKIAYVEAAQRANKRI